MRVLFGLMSSLTLSVTDLHRYAIKGLSFDALEAVELKENRFPHDRKYALLKQKSASLWSPQTFLHKENFLCAFTSPEVLAKLISTYDDASGSLEIRDRVTKALLFGPVNMEHNYKELGTFMSKYARERVMCVTSGDFQFGNTGSGVKLNNDENAQTIHIVFRSTVQALADKVGIDIQPSRFRPNMVIDTDAPPFSEFEWIGKSLQVDTRETRLRIINKTVRCNGVSVDPHDPTAVLDIPGLLSKFFPQHGPYLGVYCILERAGELRVGDSLTVVD